MSQNNRNKMRGLEITLIRWVIGVVGIGPIFEVLEASEFLDGECGEIGARQI